MEEASRKARLAVQRDGEGRMEEAASLYEEALRLIRALPNAATLEAVCKEYETRARVLRLKLFEHTMHKKSPSVESRLRELRNGKESEVAQPSVVLAFDDDDESEDTKTRKLLEMVQAEVRLEGIHDGNDVDDVNDPKHDDDDDDEDSDSDDAISLAVKAKEKVLAARAAARLNKK